ncbi:MAG: ATP-binding protein [Thermodesulfobacteriota bacterium]
MIDEFYRLSRQFLQQYHRPYKRYFLKKHTLSHRFCVITGQRGVGKSTALIQYLADYCAGDTTSKKILYVPADHFITGRYSLYEIAETFVNFGGEFICFDEVHKYPDWSRELKSIFDTFVNVKMIASGSSMLEIQRGSHDLSRRALVYKLEGLSFREFIELLSGMDLPAFALDQILKEHESISNSLVAAVEKTGKKILPLFNDYLTFGFYPYFLEFKDISLFHITLEQQIHTTVEADLAAVQHALTGGSIRKIKKLLSVIAANVPFTPDITKLMNIIQVGDARTLKTYLNYLEDGGIIRQFGKAGRSLDRLEKPEKIYLNNTNQVFALAGLTDGNRGTIRETFFATMLSTTGNLSIPRKGDFLHEDRFLFEIGGKNKTRKQIAGVTESYRALDDMEHGFDDTIPLWLFGFLY